MLKTLLLLLLLSFSTRLFAQTQGNDPLFVEYNNGEIKTTQNLRLVADSPTQIYLILDRQDTLKLHQLKAYQDKTGYYHKFRLKKTPVPIWYKREIAGTINLYNRLESNDYKGNSYGSSAIDHSPGFTPVQKVRYFQIGDIEPQKMEFAALFPLVSANSEAARLMKQGRKKSNIKLATTLVGTGIFIGGIAHTMDWLLHGDTTKPFGIQYFSPYALIGAATIGVSAFLPSGKKAYKKAIIVFNGG